MTDQELIAMARLAQRDERMSTGALYGDLADRIEALTAERKKAVEALGNLLAAADTGWRFTSARNKARATLAKLKGESHE